MFIVCTFTFVTILFIYKNCTCFGCHIDAAHHKSCMFLPIFMTKYVVIKI